MSALLGFLGKIAPGLVQTIATRLDLKGIRRRIRARDLPPAAGTHFTILVADLAQDDANHAQTAHMTESLRDISLKRCEDSLKAALEIFTKFGATRQVSMVSRDLAEASSLIAHRQG